MNKLATWTKVPGAAVSKKRARRPVRKVSKKRSKDYAEWKRVEREVLKEHPTCQACVVLARVFKKWPHTPRKSVEGHHLRGRNGSLYTDKKFVMAVCRQCHDWIHRDPALSIPMKLLGGPGEWGDPFERCKDCGSALPNCVCCDHS